MPHSDPTTVNRWWSILDDIDRMLAEIPDTIMTISGYSIDPAGRTKSIDPPLPGGDVLDITGPWASNATYGDEPTPRQVIVEWDQTLRAHWAESDDMPPIRSYAVALRALRDNTERILESPYRDAWCDDIEAVHGRLRAHCPPVVDETHDDSREPIDLTKLGHLIPDGKLLSRKEAEQFFPGITRGGWAALRKRAQRAREAGEEVPPGLYLIEWIRDTAQRTCT